MTKTTKPQLTESERAVCALADAGFGRISIARKLHLTKREVREALVCAGRRVDEDDAGEDDDVEQAPVGGGVPGRAFPPAGLDPAAPGEWSPPPDHRAACRAHLGDLVREYPNVARELYLAARAGLRLTIADYGATEAGRAA